MSVLEKVYDIHLL